MSAALAATSASWVRAQAQAEHEPTPRIAVIIPCYNVSLHVADVIASVPPNVALVIAVDDASTDETLQVLAAVDDPRLVVLRRDRNGGVGAAMKAGYMEALRRGADICVKMDGDGQMASSDLDALTSAVRRGIADYAKGNRFVDLAALRQMPRARLVGNACLSFAGKAASGYWNMLDVTNGYTAVSGTMLRRLSLDRLSDRYFFEISMLIELNILGARVIDVTMPARYGNERSSLRLSRVLTTFPGMLVGGLLRRFYWRYLIEDFGVVSVAFLTGLPMLAFGILFGATKWIHSIRTGQLASAGTVILAALPVMLGVQLILVAIVLDVLSSRTLKRASDQPRSTTEMGPAGLEPATVGL